MDFYNHPNIIQIMFLNIAFSIALTLVAPTMEGGKYKDPHHHSFIINKRQHLQKIKKIVNNQSNEMNDKCMYSLYLIDTGQES